MSLKPFFAKIFAKKIYKKTQLWVDNPIETQHNVFWSLIQQAKRHLFSVKLNLEFLFRLFPH